MSKTTDKLTLAELLSAVLRHPDIPMGLYNAIGEEIADRNIDCDAPEYIALALANREPEAVRRYRERRKKGGK
jgi:hypothetical protein